MTAKRFYLLTVALFISLVSTAQLRINELMSKNVSSLRDGYTNYSMWVEVYNESNQSINLADYYFSDQSNETQKWNAGNISMPAKSFKVLFFERDDRKGHANFKLDADGGKLFLFSNKGELIDQLHYPALFRNASYGRLSEDSEEWAHFENGTPGKSNTYGEAKLEQYAPPSLTEQAGFYSSSLSVAITHTDENVTIYYTTDGSEPSQKSKRYTTPLSLSTTSILRTKAYGNDKLPSDVVTATYFIGTRNFNLPVVSVVSDPQHLFSDRYGIYVEGSNGKGNYCDPTPKNYNQDWDRPANFEYFDWDKQLCLSQEVDVAISGGCTRYNGLKSLKIKPRKKLGNNHLEYDFFPNSKPGRRFKDVTLRNSSNDFYHSMMRDACIQTIVGEPLKQDYLAYQPVVIFLNGIYYGLINLRERSNKDFLYSNYGLSEEEVIIEEASYDSFPQGKDYQAFYHFFADETNMNREGIEDEIEALMDVDNYINYNIAEIFSGNTDWPHNNYKMWKRRIDGRWRWILFDLDFGYAGNGNVQHNTLAFALGQNNSWSEWSVTVFRKLMENDWFRNRFIDQICIEAAHTFDSRRSYRIIDSLANQISSEIVYHKNKWGSYSSLAQEVGKMKNYAQQRPNIVLNHVSQRYLSSVKRDSLHLSSNVAQASYRFNDAFVPCASLDFSYFRQRPLAIEALPIDGYRFSHWEKIDQAISTPLFNRGSEWSYFVSSVRPAANWYATTYNDASWPKARAQFGYGNKGETTVISYGGNPSNKYTTSYYRKKVTIKNVADKAPFVLKLLVDDGAVVYVNGKELGRYNMPSGTVNYNTFSTTYSVSGDWYETTIPASMLQEGENLFAVEVHQCDLTSSDVVFDLSVEYVSEASKEIIDEAVFSAVLSGSSLHVRAIYEPDESFVADTIPWIYLNEVVASNNRIADEYGETDDYIELYNGSNQAIDLGGWYLSDQSSYPMLSRIPSHVPEQTTLQPGQWMMLWADGSPEQGALHLNFKLSAAGETIYLSREVSNRLQLVDSISYPALGKNVSYSRRYDGGYEWIVAPPTPGASNEGTQDGLAQLQQGFDVYPRVFERVVYLTGLKRPARYALFDLSGKQLRQGTLLPDDNQLDLLDLAQGFYLLRIEDQCFKLLKN